MKLQRFWRLLGQRFRQVIGLYLLIFVPMWGMYALNKTVLFGIWNAFGIVPRTLDVGSMMGVVASWTMHGNFAHLWVTLLCWRRLCFCLGYLRVMAIEPWQS